MSEPNESSRFHEGLAWVFGAVYAVGVALAFRARFSPPSPHGASPPEVVGYVTLNGVPKLWDIKLFLAFLLWMPLVSLLTGILRRRIADAGFHRTERFATLAVAPLCLTMFGWANATPPLFPTVFLPILGTGIAVLAVVGVNRLRADKRSKSS